MPRALVRELYLGRAGLAQGYWARGVRTAERVVPDPFCEVGGGRLFRTGDQGRYRADGVLEYLGRGDHQVKIRGYRIELGEIESRLGQHPQVQSCVVVSREEEAGDKRLVAYYTGKEKAPSAQAAPGVEATGSVEIAPSVAVTPSGGDNCQ